jgi:hypothetical protein
MVHQARIYFAGAVSGTALIGMAVVAFVVLVSLQALRDWPLAGLGEGGDGGSVAPARPVGGEAGPGGGRLGTTAAAGGSAVRADGRNAPRLAGVGGGGSTAATGGGRALTGSPPSAPSPSGGDSTQAPAGSQPSGSAGSSPSGGGAASGAGESDGGGGSGGGPPSGGESGGSPKPSETVTGTVDRAVSGVDEATGGALGQTGLPQATEEVVEKVAGAGSPVGGTLDHTVEAVGGLLGGGR